VPDKVKALPSVRNAELEAVLFEYIEPVVLLFKRGLRSFYVGSPIPGPEGVIEKYFVVSVTPKHLKRYFRQEADLRYLFAYPRERRYFTVEATEIHKATFSLEAFDGEVEDDWLPGPQFFAESHTSDYSLRSDGPVDLEVLNIDGNWELEDFGSLSRLMRDLYAFEDCMDKVANTNTQAKKVSKITEAFTGKPLRGGSGYRSLFGDLVACQERDDRFDLKRIKYASPGQIELTGQAQLFDAIEAKVRNFVLRRHELRDAYNMFHKYMSDAGLLEIQNSLPQVSPTQMGELKARSQRLLEQMNMPIFEELHVLTENNVIKTAKVTLAIYRRFKSASEFFVQGRVHYPD
jgi:hypothetical protein